MAVQPAAECAQLRGLCPERCFTGARHQALLVRTFRDDPVRGYHGQCHQGGRAEIKDHPLGHQQNRQGPGAGLSKLEGGTPG